ncbi:hypothetical protein ACXYMP_11070 [Aliiroseovarius sp. CAU 1755]
MKKNVVFFASMALLLIVLLSLLPAERRAGSITAILFLVSLTVTVFGFSAGKGKSDEDSDQ